MKRKILVFLFAIMAVFALIGSNIETKATSATSTTYTLDYKGNWVASNEKLGSDTKAVSVYRSNPEISSIENSTATIEINSVESKQYT